ncbi:AraC family transcriptional regulator [Rhodopirellula sp. MGV]|uniref:AraC family transcriptional regulator n=1 Tax=Rhodopirellula sp. MGV TaxID=2023130 RepID=UPI0018E99204|nr:AraC family transcriptional regulator [Rhodopirellula sp. MGV]
MSPELKKIAQIAQRHATADGELHTSVPRLTIYRSSSPTDYDAVVYLPSLCVILQGAKEVVVGGEAFRYDPAQSLLVSVDMPAATRVVEASAKNPCLAIRIEIQSVDVAELLAGGAMVPARTSTSRGIGVIPVENSLLDAIRRLLALMDTPNDIESLAPLILREITYRLLSGPEGIRLRQTAASGGPAQRIARAISWLKEHFAEPAKVESVASHVGLSPSAFHQHFKRMTGLSPLQYQKRFRLQEARRLMFSEGLEAAEAAFRVGYESPSQFGREYRRLFGAPPRQDIADLTANSAAPGVSH